MSVTRITGRQYRRLQGKRRSLVDLLDQPEGRTLEFEPPRLGKGVFRPRAKRPVS